MAKLSRAKGAGPNFQLGGGAVGDQLMLDEATSNLDAESEAAVQTALARVRAGRTTLIVAHRLSTVRDADRIVVIDGGKVAAEGSHSELMRISPLYERLYEAHFQRKAA